MSALSLQHVWVGEAVNNALNPCNSDDHRRFLRRVCNGRGRSHRYAEQLSGCGDGRDFGLPGKPVCQFDLAAEEVMRHRVNAVGRMAKFKVVSHQAAGGDLA